MKSASRDMSMNVDNAVVEGFGREWSRYDQSALSEGELREIFDQYFDIFPWESLPQNASGFDLGCGSGRWARFVGPRVHRLVCIDPSPQALDVARRNLAAFPQIEFVDGSAGALALETGQFDFGYCLGVLHHTPDVNAGLTDAVRILKPGAPLLLYLYYALDNRPRWFRIVWRLSDAPRRVISRLPYRLRSVVCDAIAVTVYLPIARVLRFSERRGARVERIPLAAYRQRSFYVMRTDALDRFGTRLERRFTRDEVVAMMQACGLNDITVGESSPYWRAVVAGRSDEPPASGET
jgi:SAM-dependent methyltransferase